MTGWAIEALLASTALLALVLVARGPVRRAFGPGAAYALWVLPALRVVLPPLPADWMPAAPVPFAAASEQAAAFVAAAPLPVEAAPLLGAALVAAWGVGALLVLGWHVGRYRRFTRRVAASGVTLGRVGRIGLVVSDAVADPLAYGLVRPVVAVPRDFRARYDATERELALAHEVAHHQRGDLFANWAALAVLALHWFDPLAWIAFRAFRADQEMANDAHVLAHRSLDQRHAYGCAIVKAACGAAPAAACGLNTVDDLKGRLRMLARTTSRGRRAAGIAAVAGSTLALLGLTASGGEAAETMRAQVERATGVPLDALAPIALLQTPPAPPPVPAPPAPGTRDRDVHVVRHNGSRSVTVVENGRTRHFEGAEADAWLAANPLPVPPAPPAPPALARAGTPPLPPQVRRDGRVPPAPPAPPAPAVGAMPPAPPAPPIADLARASRLMAESTRTMPRVVSRPCGGGGGATTLDRVEKGRVTTVICTDRIAAATRHAQLAAVDAGQMHRVSMTRAINGLRRARVSLADRPDAEIATAARQSALAGIDASLARLERQLSALD